MPSSLVCCLGGHRVLKPMHPTKFLGCNSWTLPFPIPAGGQGPAGLQSARSRAGPAGQSSGFWPLDLQRTLGCLGKPRGSDLSAKGWSGQGLEPKGEAFLRPPGCANRGRTTWFPAPRSPSSLTCGPHPSAAPTGCRSLGTQERTQWAFPAATATPERTTRFLFFCTLFFGGCTILQSQQQSMLVHDLCFKDFFGCCLGNELLGARVSTGRLTRRVIIRVQLRVNKGLD